jgi:chromosome partitioning protein
MLTQTKVLNFFEENQAISVSTLEKESGLSAGLISKVKSGERSFTPAHLEKLMPVLVKYGYRESAKRDGQAKVITILNHKGGVSKTTTAMNVGRSFALKGYRTLVVDVDAQANATALGGLEYSETNVFDENGAKPIALSENFFLIPSNIDIYEWEDHIRNEFDCFDKLRKILSPLREEFDFILIDTPPSLGIFTSNAIIACDDVLIPTQTQAHSAQGLVKVMDLINKVNYQKDMSIGVLGVLLTQTTNTIASNHITEELKETFGEKIFETSIPNYVAYQEATLTGQTIFDYLKDAKTAGKAAQAYDSLTDEIIQRYGK